MMHSINCNFIHLKKSKNSSIEYLISLLNFTVDCILILLACISNTTVACHFSI